MTNIFINGLIKKLDDARFNPSLFSLNYAVCAFEGIRSYVTEDRSTLVFRLKDHCFRMIKSMDYLGMESDFKDVDKMIEAISTLIIANGSGNQYIRPIAFFDEGIMSVKNRPNLNFAVMSFPFQKDMPMSAHKLFISGICSDISTQNYKISRNYFGSFMALNTIVGEKDNFEVIQYDENKNICETSAHNIFLKFENSGWITPPDDSCLSGITRHTAIELLRENGIGVEKRSIQISELVGVTSCFLTSTAGEIINVSHIDGRRLNSECNDVLEIISNYRSLVTGKTNTRSEWITYV